MHIEPLSQRQVYIPPCNNRSLPRQKKADHHAAELAQVLRRERAGQGCIADAKAEVEALKEELEKTRDTFARSVPFNVPRAF